MHFLLLWMLLPRDDPDPSLIDFQARRASLLAVLPHAPLVRSFLWHPLRPAQATPDAIRALAVGSAECASKAPYSLPPNVALITFQVRHVPLLTATLGTSSFTVISCPHDGTVRGPCYGMILV